MAIPAPKSMLTGVHGWLTDAEENALIQATNRLTEYPAVIVEIGVEYGRSSSAWIYAKRQQNNPDVFMDICCVDQFPNNHFVVGDLFANWQRTVASQNPDEVGVRVHPLKGVSWDIGDQWKVLTKGDEIDILFIDGDHTYEGVTKDIQAWLTDVKSGGLVMFHDVAKSDDAHYLHKEVQRAIGDNVDLSQWQAVPNLSPDSMLTFERIAKPQKRRGRKPKSAS